MYCVVTGLTPWQRLVTYAIAPVVFHVYEQHCELSCRCVHQGTHLLCSYHTAIWDHNFSFWHSDVTDSYPMLLTVIQWLPSLCRICTNSPHTTLNWCIGTSNEDCSPLILPCLYHSAPSAALLSCHLATCCLASSSLSLLLLTGHFHNVCSSQIVHIVIWLCSTHESCMYLEEHLVKSEIRGEFDSHQ